MKYGGIDDIIGASFGGMMSTKTAHAHVAIVGAGPRGTSALERLCSSASSFLKPGVRLTIHVIDPSSPGAGRVWRTSQSTDLLMNTVASQITLFTDESVNCEGPINTGPSLYQWAAATDIRLGPDEYPTRALYGRYLEWVFKEVTRRLPSGMDVKVHGHRAIRLDEALDGCQTLTLSGSRTISGLSAVILAQGHLPLRPEPKQQQASEYARQYGLRHIQPVNPADIDLSTIAPEEPVVLRGLGLNFFDYMALFTVGRGGKFIKTSEGLRYNPSGKEPRMFAGSRRGIPYHARGDNAKGPYGRHMPVIFKEKVIQDFQQRIDSGQTLDFKKEIWPLAAKEIELVYYEALLKSRESVKRASEIPRTGKLSDRVGVSKRRSQKPTVQLSDKSEAKLLQRVLEQSSFRERFLATQHNSAEEMQVLDDFSISRKERWSWDWIQKPYADATFNSAEEWQSWLLTHLREDAEQARLGNVKGPLKAALDVMRDLRNELRLIVDHGALTGNSRQKHLDRWYTPLNAYLSIGPPRQRIEQMIALMEAGILKVLGPKMEVEPRDGAWLARSPEIPGSVVRATTLIEARLPDISLRNTGDELLSHMLEKGECRPHTLNGIETEGMDVTASPYNVIDSQGRKHRRRFAVGVPTEGVHWVTAAGARPGVNSVTLLDTDAVARAALEVVESETESGRVEHERNAYALVNSSMTAVKAN